MNLFRNFAIGILFLQAGCLLADSTNRGKEFNDEDDVGCDPQIADSCFSDVQDDLRLVLDPNNNYFQTKNMSLLRDLCSAWNDSLICTSDIIDDGCREADGRKTFDQWNAVLKTTLQYVCKDDMRVLQDVLHSLRCFNVSAFFYCVEKTANLKNVQDLMAVDLDDKECRYINTVVMKCGEYVSSESCAWEVLEPLNGIFYAFFDAANCSNVPTTFSNNNDVGCDPQIADSCFTDVQDDLRLILNPATNYFQAKNVSLLRDLCSAWNDSLSCTTDVIDDICVEDEGRLKFDHWNAVLRRTFEYVCKDEMIVLQDIFRSTRCFNISIFMNCVESTANLTNVQDLMAASLDDLECSYIRKVIRECGELVMSDTCAQEVVTTLDNVFDTFFEAADCKVPIRIGNDGKTEASANNLAITSFLNTSIFATALFFKFLQP